jgi:hypothetical protein
MIILPHNFIMPEDLFSDIIKTDQKRALIWIKKRVCGPVAIIKK